MAYISPPRRISADSFSTSSREDPQIFLSRSNIRDIPEGCRKGMMGAPPDMHTVEGPPISSTALDEGSIVSLRRDGRIFAKPRRRTPLLLHHREQVTPVKKRVADTRVTNCVPLRVPRLTSQWDARSRFWGSVHTRRVPPSKKKPPLSNWASRRVAITTQPAITSIIATRSSTGPRTPEGQVLAGSND